MCGGVPRALGSAGRRQQDRAARGSGALTLQSKRLGPFSRPTLQALRLRSTVRSNRDQKPSKTQCRVWRARPPSVPAVGDQKGRGEEAQGQHVPPQQVQEPGVVRLVHSGKTGLSGGLSPQLGAQASQTAPGPPQQAPRRPLPWLQLLPPRERPSPTWHPKDSQGVPGKGWPGPVRGHSDRKAHLKYRKRKE